MEILALLYLIAGYWSAGLTIFYNKVIIHKFGALFMMKLTVGAVLGVFLIPTALFLKLTKRR